MHIINFFIALLLPWVGLLGFFGPTDNLVPEYFASTDAYLLAAILAAIIGFWLGFLRNFVGYNGKLSETRYHLLLWFLLIFFIASKIMYALPHMWFCGVVGYILGVFAVPKGQVVGKYSVSVLVTISVPFLLYFSFILSYFAWFGYKPSKFYYYIYYMLATLQEYLAIVRSLK